MIKKTVILILLPSILWFYPASCSAADRNEYSQVIIYYYGWDIETRSTLHLQDVRSRCQVRISIHDQSRIKSFYNWLRIDEMKPVSSSEDEFLPEDPRLVIDFVSQGDTKETYYASRFDLLTADSKFKRPINAEFRDRFRFGEEAAFER